MEEYQSKFDGILNDLAAFKTIKIPNFETDEKYASTSYLAEFEDGVWGPIQSYENTDESQKATKLQEFAKLKDRIAGYRLQAMIDMKKSG